MTCVLTNLDAPDPEIDAIEVDLDQVAEEITLPDRKAASGVANQVTSRESALITEGATAEGEAQDLLLTEVATAIGTPAGETTESTVAQEAPSENTGAERDPTAATLPTQSDDQSTRSLHTRK